ncbi:hypothetical protein [Methylomonas sp. AM2-LC]|uniref:hypothetical protein n=1 Tax=Methylomonas sp. AM2-LC TaxID=3153301 RepID=UPI003266B938
MQNQENSSQSSEQYPDSTSSRKTPVEANNDNEGYAAAAMKSCELLLSGKVYEATVFAREALPYFQQDPDTYCINSMQLIDLVEEFNVEMSLSVNKTFLKGMKLAFIEGSTMLFTSTTGNHEIDQGKFLKSFPASLGNVWRIDQIQKRTSKVQLPGMRLTIWQFFQLLIYRVMPI